MPKPPTSCTSVYLTIMQEVEPKYALSGMFIRLKLYIQDELFKAKAGIPQLPLWVHWVRGFYATKQYICIYKKRKADGGLGTLDNAQLTHPYCNTTFKN